MLIGEMDITRLIIYMKHVEEEKLKAREEFRNKRAKTSTHETKRGCWEYVITQASSLDVTQ